ncbi:GNAT family N-acetyltransferase [Rhizobium deserti]|uniref:GNAT family N-acetyltransferase n=1 Tax=Rhizobium deserti TaxID=2547961 RepID=A0A4R5U6J6_9HYPH|nr:GNAT family N-acetyltransferase [Rhizobium deserti]TDK29874.1 GNAT family N-acetyltransferase [Rhizobium deserti]
MTHFYVKPATRDDFPVLRSIELAAYETLRAAGAVAGDPSVSDDKDLHRYCEQQLLYAASPPGGDIVGWCGGYAIDGWLHVAEMDVHPDWQGKGIGRRLIQTLLDDARTRELKGATLTTDRQAAFNAPFYLSIGFRLVHPQDTTPHLWAILDEEIAAGLDPLRRAAMMLSFSEGPKP